VVDKYGPEHTPRFTFDHVAALDLPGALAHIRRVSPSRHLSIFAHCIGATCVSMALQRRLLTDFAIEECVLSTIGLFFRAPLESFLKAEDGILERVLAADPSCIGIDPAGGVEWPEEMQRAYAAWPASSLPQGSAPGDEVYRRASFMFGVPYERALVQDEVHGRVGELLGRIRLTLFMHAGQCLRRGYAAPFDAPEHGPRAEGERRGHLDATGFEGTRITLITGRSNQLWHRESVDQMYEWLRNETRGAHRKHVLPRYGHQDLLWGVDAARDIYPLILEGLAPSSSNVEASSRVLLSATG
jgi:cholesterol oxidase